MEPKWRPVVLPLTKKLLHPDGFHIKTSHFQVSDISSSAVVNANGWDLYVQANAVGAKTGLDIRWTTIPPKV